MSTLGIDLNENLFDYTYLLIRQYIGSICALYTDSNYTIPYIRRRIKLHQLNRNHFIYLYVISKVFYIC